MTDDEHDEDHDNDKTEAGIGSRLRDLAGDVVHLVKDTVGLVAETVGVAARAADKIEDRIERDDETEDDAGSSVDADEPHPGDRDGGGNRPKHEPGTSRGTMDGTPLTRGDLEEKHPLDSWPGERKDLYLPFLFMRANPGDTGTRPAIGPFWESPDILLVAGVGPDLAPPIPSQLGAVAKAGLPNTVYAHVWNFGQAPAHEVIVEFYWCDPSLGINPTSAHLIGTGLTNLGAKGSGQAHHVVKCPVAWTPTFINGGHECLLVKAFDPIADPLTTPDWDASVNRHLAQRNIHVMSASEQSLADSPLTLQVGPLFGQGATVKVERHDPTSMPWLQLHSGARGKFPAPAPATGAIGLAHPGGIPDAQQRNVTGDGATVLLSANDNAPPAGSAHVYRVTAAQGGVAFGGYTVVVIP